jgi:hypothetical protein
VLRRPLDFTSLKFSFLCNQVIFAALAYCLMQLFLLRIKRFALNRHTHPRHRNQLVPTDSVIIVHNNRRFALFTPSEHTEILLTLSAEASM